MQANSTSKYGSSSRPQALARSSSHSSLPYLNELDHVSNSDSEPESGLRRRNTRVTLNGKGMFSRADMDNDGRIDVLL